MYVRPLQHALYTCLWVGCCAVAPARSAQAADRVAVGRGSVRLTGVWGDDRLVAGDVVGDAALSKDGTTLAAVTGPGVFLWDVASGRERRIPWDGRGPMKIAFGTGERTLLVADQQRLITVDLRTGRRLVDIPLPGYEHHCTAFAGAAMRAATWDCAAERVRLWDMAAGRRLGRIAVPAGSLSLSFTGDGRRLLGATRSQGMGPAVESRFVWPVGWRAPLYSVQLGHNLCVSDRCPPEQVVVTDGRSLLRALPAQWRPSPYPDGDHVRVRRAYVELVDLDRGDRATLAETGNDTRLVLAANGRVMAMGTAVPNEIAVWNLVTANRRATVTLPGADWDRAQLSATGRYLLVQAGMDRGDGRVVLARTTDGRVLWHKDRVVAALRRPLMLDVDEESGLVVYRAWPEAASTHRLVAWEIETGRAVVEVANAVGEHVPCFGRSSRLLCLESATGFQVRSAPAWRPAFSSNRQPGQIVALAVSADRRWLASATDVGDVLVRDLSGAVAPAALPPAGPVEQLVFVGNGPLLAVALRERAFLFDPAAGKIVAETKTTLSSAGAVLGARLLDGGRRVAFASHLTALEIRDIVTSRQVARRDGWCAGGRANLPSTGLDWCVFRDDDGRRSVRSADGTLLWELSSEREPLAVSADGRLLLVTDRQRGELLVSRSDDPLRLHRRQRDWRDLAAFTADGRKIITTHGMRVYLWDGRSGRLVDTIDFHPRLDRPMAVHSVGAALFVGTARGLVYRFEERPKGATTSRGGARCVAGRSRVTGDKAASKVDTF